MREYRLSELYDNVSTNSLSRALLYDDGDVLNLHYGDIHLKYSGLLDISKAELPFALKTDYKFKESSRMETGDVIFADAAEDYEGIGKAVEIGQTGDTPSYAGLHTIHLKRRTDNLASGYMGYLSQAYAFRRKVWFIAQGAKVLGISSKELLKQSIVIPEITEQNIIVSRLKAVDQKINLLTKKKEALETYKKGLMQKIFSQELRFKREDGTDYPEWEYLPLEVFCSVIRGITYNSGNVVSDGGTLVLRSTNIQSNELDYSEGTKQFIDVIPKSNLVLKDKDIIVCMSNGSKRLVGKSAVFNQADYNGIITAGGFCAIFRSKNPLTPYLLQSAMWKKYLHILLAGSSINNLRNNEVSQLRFQMPSQDEALRISELLNAVDNRIKLVFSQINETSKMKEGLLQQMFV